jgi:hypothetical protein
LIELKWKREKSTLDKLLKKSTPSLF